MLKQDLFENIIRGLAANHETLLAFLQASSPDGLWYWDVQTSEHYVSPEFWVTLGYELSDIPQHENAWRNLIHRDDWQIALADMQKHLVDPKHRYDQVLCYRHKNGSTIWLCSRGAAIRDEDGEPLGILGTYTNVTEFKSAEKQEWKNAQDYEAILNNQRAYIIKTDAEGNYTYANDLFLSTFNLERSTVMGTSSMDSIYVEDHPKAIDTAIACLEHPHQHFKVFLRKLMDDGSFKTTNWDFIGLTNDQGNTTEILCVGVDVTQQLEAEADLQRKNTLLEDAQRLAKMGAWEFDAAGIGTFTDQMYAIHELPIGTPIDSATAFSFYHPDDLPIIKDAVNRAVEQQEPYDVECRFITAKGNHRWVRTSGQPIVENGQVVRLIGMFQDITEQKEDEIALRKSEAKFRSLVENATDLIVMLNPQGEYAYISPKGKEIVGFDTETLIGTSFVSWIHPDDLNAVYAAFAEAIKSKKAHEGVVYRAKHGDGTWHWFSANGAPLVDDAGNVSAILAITRDITHDKVAEQAMHTTLRRLEQSNQQNTMLMKEIHHRVKNNLAVISALLSLRARGLQDPSAKHALQESRDRIKVMAEVHELMYQHDSNERIAFDRYLSGLVERMQRTLGNGKQKVRFALDVGQVELSIDQAVPLGLIINELLTNTVKHAFPADHSDPQVTIIATADDTLTVTVTDNGVGVADTTTLETSDSLGMTVINSLTEQLEGQVAFESRPQSDIGLQVTLQVPLA